MSVIDKKPFIETLLDSLSADELKTLRSLINGATNNPIKRSLIYGSTTPLTASDKGIKEAVIELSGYVTQSLYNGYLIYTDSYCVLISYANEKASILTMISMQLVDGKWKYEFKPCTLTILELRSELADRLIEAGAIIPDNVKFTVDNIKELTDAECEQLKVGDIVAKKTGDQYHTYVVTYKEADTGLCLTYADASVVETQSYDYSGSHWVYNSEDKTELGGGVTPEDLYGKFVRIMDAPSSTTLTNDQFNIIKEGVFIKGDFLGFHNPILLPFNYGAGSNYGVIFGILSGNNYVTYIRGYGINPSTKVIGLTADYGKTIALRNLKSINEKDIPDYPTLSSGDAEKVLTYKDDNTLAWKELVGSFVRIMDAPSSDILTDDQVEIFKEGVFINGDFLGYHNPVFFPSGKRPSGQYQGEYGTVIGTINGDTYFQEYLIDTVAVGATHNKITLKDYRYLKFSHLDAGMSITIEGQNVSINSAGSLSIKNKVIPNYPADTGSFTLKCVAGVLTWVQDA